MPRCLMIVALLAGCQHRDSDTRTSQAQPQPSVATKTAPSEPGEPGKPAASGSISGTVVETMNASTYTYARLDRGGSEIWVAGPQVPLAVGTKLDKLEGQLMTDFYSKTLDRTFAQIYFVTSLGAAPAASAHAAAATAHPSAAADAGEGVSGTVLRTMEAGGYTYAELDHGGKKVWVAGPTTKLAVGTKLGKMAGSLMTSFHSNTLNRTFDEIYFVGTYAITN